MYLPKTFTDKAQNTDELMINHRFHNLTTLDFTATSTIEEYKPYFKEYPGLKVIKIPAMQKVVLPHRYYKIIDSKGKEVVPNRDYMCEFKEDMPHSWTQELMKRIHAGKKH